MVKLFLKNFNLCDHNSPTSRTDGQTNRQTTCDRNTALCTKVRRAVKREGKERKGKVHKVTRRYNLAICGADTPGPILVKFGVCVAFRNVTNMSNFCDKIFRGFRSTGGQISLFSH